MARGHLDEVVYHHVGSSQKFWFLIEGVRHFVPVCHVYGFGLGDQNRFFEEQLAVFFGSQSKPADSNRDGIRLDHRRIGVDAAAGDMQCSAGVLDKHLEPAAFAIFRDAHRRFEWIVDLRFAVEDRSGYSRKRQVHAFIEGYPEITYVDAGFVGHFEEFVVAHSTAFADKHGRVRAVEGCAGLFCHLGSVEGVVGVCMGKHDGIDFFHTEFFQGIGDRCRVRLYLFHEIAQADDSPGP